ncbi:MAG: glycosyltransferase family 1 protein [Armatimonadota bacterium]
MDSKPKRVLHVVSAMNRGGAETMIMNIYRYIDRNKLQFDFIVHVDSEGHYDQEIKSLGGRIFYIGSLGNSGSIKYIRNLKNVISENGPFTAVHSHTDFQGGFVALGAKLAGIKKRIVHSHNTDWHKSNSIVNYIILFVLKGLINAYATDKCACGRDAALFLFGQTAVNNKDIRLINNSINVDSFVNAKAPGRSSLGIADDCMIIGHIGRFYEQKNHKHIIDIAKAFKSHDYRCRFVLAGDGPVRKEIEQSILENGLLDYIKLLGIRNDIPELMKLFDVFIMPSLFEGLPVVLIEAQASGTPCVISDVITDEVDMGLDLVKQISLQAPIDSWVTAIIDVAENRKRPASSVIHKALTDRGYDVSENLNHLYELYNVDV